MREKGKPVTVCDTNRPRSRAGARAANGAPSLPGAVGDVAVDITISNRSPAPITAVDIINSNRSPAPITAVDLTTEAADATGSIDRAKIDIPSPVSRAASKLRGPGGETPELHGGEALMREIAVAELHVGDHVELGVEGYDVSDVEQRPGQVEVVDTAGWVHIYSAGAVVAVR